MKFRAITKKRSKNFNKFRSITMYYIDYEVMSP